MQQRIIALAAFGSLVGEEVAVSDWFTVSQDRIDLFARATDDFQWIHVDQERAAQSPFGSTIAHGFLTLGLLVPLFESAIAFEASELGLNYGLNKVRFTAPVPAGSRIRGRFTLKEVQELSPGVQLTWTATIEREGTEKPALIAEWIVRRFERAD
ncbi:MaoC family dehydratase [Rhodoligotrophos ferricapiens]|uniref:MaoC family dehydratase n=1 Tax=Rhodoligotrophos ferricapiens TaxID=3069264 RepID=UPI00315D39BE